MNSESIYQLEVGVDISKAILSVHVLGKRIDYPNTKPGLTKLFTALTKHKKSYRITCESTGSYGALLIMRAFEKKIPISQVNPVQIKDYIRSFGKLAKTDSIDACFIAKFSADRNPPILGESWKEVFALKESLRTLRQFIGLRSELKASQDKYQSKIETKRNEKAVRYFDREIKTLEAFIITGIKENRNLSKRFETIMEVKGVGPKTAMSLVLEMPELGSMNRKQAAALAGLAPMHNESGNHDGERYIRRGRKGPRTALYMASFVASRCNPMFKSTYDDLIERGKPHKKAVIAVARKLLIYLNTCLKPQPMEI